MIDVHTVLMWKMNHGLIRIVVKDTRKCIQIMKCSGEMNDLTSIAQLILTACKKYATIHVSNIQLLYLLCKNKVCRAEISKRPKQVGRAKHRVIYEDVSGGRGRTLWL